MCLFFCPLCERENEMLSVKDAAIVANVTTRTIHNWKRSNKLHVFETPGKRKLVCKASLVGPCSTLPDRN
jgi:hypothetical protein